MCTFQIVYDIKCAIQHKYKQFEIRVIAFKIVKYENQF